MRDKGAKKASIMEQWQWQREINATGAIIQDHLFAKCPRQREIKYSFMQAWPSEQQYNPFDVWSSFKVVNHFMLYDIALICIRLRHAPKTTVGEKHKMITASL